MRSVAGVHDIGRYSGGEIHAGSGGRVAHYHHIHLHGQDIVYRVEERFSLAHTAAGGREIDNVGAQAAFGELERHPRACTALEKQIGHRHIAQ